MPLGELPSADSARDPVGPSLFFQDLPPDTANQSSGSLPAARGWSGPIVTCFLKNVGSLDAPHLQPFGKDKGIQTPGPGGKGS